MVMLPKLPTLAVLWMVLGPAGENVNKTADGGSSDGGFGPSENGDVNKSANGCSSMDTFGPRGKYANKTANGGSSMDCFGPAQIDVNKTADGSSSDGGFLSSNS